MRKQVLSLVMVLVMLFGVAAQAARPMKTPGSTSRLSFSDTMANCYVAVKGKNATDRITVNARLWSGSSCMRNWNESGTYQVSFTRQAKVVKGKAYKLTVDYTINGVKQPQKSTTGICN